MDEYMDVFGNPTEPDTVEDSTDPEVVWAGADEYEDLGLADDTSDGDEDYDLGDFNLPNAVAETVEIVQVTLDPSSNGVRVACYVDALPWMKSYTLAFVPPTEERLYPAVEALIRKDLAPTTITWSDGSVTTPEPDSEPEPEPLRPVPQVFYYEARNVEIAASGTTPLVLSRMNTPMLVNVLGEETDVYSAVEDLYTLVPGEYEVVRADTGDSTDLTVNLSGVWWNMAQIDVENNSGQERTVSGTLQVIVTPVEHDEGDEETE